MQRLSFFAYGVFCHLLFLVIYVYMAGFVGGFLVPWSIDSVSVDGLRALGIDLLLVGLFAVQHSVMARPWFKERWTRLIPQPIERSTYVLFSCVVTFVLMWQWRGIDVVVWDVQQPLLRTALWGVFAIGWLLVPAVTLMLNHFDLFGTRQVWLYLRGRDYESLPFAVPMLYKRMRHPLYVGWTISFWAIPTMTAGHLLFAAATTAYIIIAVKMFEERDLLREHGERYRTYMEQVGGFIPKGRFRGSADVEEAV